MTALDVPLDHDHATPHPMRMLVGADWIDGDGDDRIETIDPYAGTAWATIPRATAADVDRAVRTARAAFEGAWGSANGRDRAALMVRLAELLEQEAPRLARLESTDNGKVVTETVRQVRFAARNYRYFAGYADKITGETIPLDRPDAFDYTLREPYGVAALITAWNSPISLMANKLAPALAAGNAVVVKPSEFASVTTLEVARLALEAGFPPGTINVVTGDGSTGTALTRAAGVDRLSFTGGPMTGARVAEAAAANLVPVTLELGGKSPNIVFADADLDRAVRGAVAGIFGATGQSCIAGSRLLVQRPVYDEVIGRVAEAARRIRLGDPLDPRTHMGPVANRPQLDRVLEYIELGRTEGASLIAGGGTPSNGSGPALFVEPTVFGDVGVDMRIAQEEIFGPVLCALPFDDADEAVAIGNATPFGLAAGIWTRDLATAHRMARRLRAGTVWVNTYRESAAMAPFGGTARSGYGRERGAQAVAEYTRIKNVLIDLSDSTADPFPDDEGR